MMPAAPATLSTIAPKETVTPLVAPPWLRDVARLIGAAVDQSLKTQLDEKDRQRPRLIRTSFWPSDLFNCRRKVALGFREVSLDSVAPRVKEARYWGNVFHKQYYERLLCIPNLRVIATEQKISIAIPGINTPLRGRFDVLGEIRAADIAAVLNVSLPEGVPPDEIIPFLLDVKSASPYTARQVAETGRPLRTDEAEVTCYMHSLRVPLALVVYHDKASNIREIAPVFYSESAFGEIAEWVRSVYHVLRAGELPDAEFDTETTNFPCSFCSYLTTCRELGPGSPLPIETPQQKGLSDEQAAALRVEGEKLLTEIVNLEEIGSATTKSVKALRTDIERIVEQVGSIELPDIASARLSTRTEWDLEALAAQLRSLGRLQDVLEISTSKVADLVSSGSLPASLIADTRRREKAGIRISKRRRQDGVTVAAAASDTNDAEGQEIPPSVH